MTLQQAYEILEKARRQAGRKGSHRMNIYGSAVEVGGIVHRATKFVGTTSSVVFPKCRPTLNVHSFQEGTERTTTCKDCLF